MASLLKGSGRKSTGISQGPRELQDFYALPDGTMFVTMADGHLWWALIQGPVVPLADAALGEPTRFRRTQRGWSSKSLSGEPLELLNLTSALTRTGNYRGTLCAVEREDYLLRRIRGVPEPLQVQAVGLRKQMQDLGDAMIRQLHWRDLEALTDRIFARDGWKRISVLGQDQPDVDLVLEHSTTDLRAWVQVKTGAGNSISSRI